MTWRNRGRKTAVKGSGADRQAALDKQRAEARDAFYAHLPPIRQYAHNRWKRQPNQALARRMSPEQERARLKVSSALLRGMTA